LIYLAWLAWAVAAIFGVTALGLVMFFNTAVPGVSSFLSLVVVVAVLGCAAASLRLMLRRSFVTGIILACLLIPLMFLLGIGFEELDAWFRQRQ
jgi:hypothetical protein